MTVNPTHWSGLPRHELLDAVCAGFDEAAAAGLTDCRVVVSILREQPGEDALELVRALGGYRPARVVGLGVDGDETAAGPTGPRFAPAFAEARAIGLGRTAHAGESSGPAGVASALDDLRVTRIDHGVRSVEDQELVRRLAGDGTALNICLTSNLALLYADLADHPIRRLLVAGVAVTINTDDPVPLRTTLTDELALAAAHCGWSLADAVAATARAIDAAFCRPDEAAALRSRLDAYAGAALPRGEASATRH
ncbi:MAG: adenosine deaminase family protein [Acidimicrobiales bacterium]